MSVTRYWSLESAHANSRLERTLRATEILVRFLMQLDITAVGFWLFISQSRSSNAGLALIYPLFLGIPGIIVILIIFAPIEAAGIKRGARWISLIAIPLVAAALPWLLFPFAGNLNNFIQGSVPLSGIGFVWGFLWVITRPIYAVFKPASSAQLEA